MPDTYTGLSIANLLAVIAALVTGAVVLWSNPVRPINRAFCALSFHVALWMLCMRESFFSSTEGLKWLRITSAVGAFLPLNFWFLQDVVVLGWGNWVARLRRAVILIVVSLMLATLCFTDFFIPPTSTSDNLEYGLGYFLFLVGALTAQVTLMLFTRRRMKIQEGVRRVELQILLLGGTAVGVSIVAALVLAALLRNRLPVHLVPILIFLYYLGTAWAMTTTRVFDARHILLFGLQRTLLVVTTTVLFVFVNSIFELILPSLVSVTIAIATCLWSVTELNSALQSALHLNARGAHNARAAAYEVARRETRLERLVDGFSAILKGWAKSDVAVILFGGQGSTRRDAKIEVSPDSTAMRTLRELKWATPERFARERSTPERDELLKFMKDHSLGAMVSSGASSLSVAIGVGLRASRRPFTYPEITQLAELASIIENALARSHLSVKAQHAEQLATVGVLGASLAHEIRNPLVSIKTFVQLLPHHYQDQAFRDKFFRLIGDEVGRIDRLTEQLLDLAAPRAFNPSEIALHPVLQASLELVEAKASEKDVELIPAFEANPDTAYADPNAAKQVLLNLCFNAIQAIENRPGPRWVKISTRRISSGLELAVTDNGPGIPEDVRPRLFQPFQTTKSTGFGLGLAICSDIVAGLGGTISADPAMPGAGATFRVLFPCQRPTS